MPDNDREKDAMVSAIRSVLLLLLFAGLLPASQAADTDSHYDRVAFQVQARETVANDRMQVVLAAEAEEAAPAAVADAINKTMQWALERAKKTAGVTLSTGQYNISALYNKNAPQRWRGSQELLLEGGDFVVLSELMGTLQSRLQVKSTRFMVADATRATVEERLIKQAIAQFRSRAGDIARDFGAKDYTLVTASVNTGGPSARPVTYMRAMAAEASVAAPAMEAGESDVVVTVNGEVELIR